MSRARNEEGFTMIMTVIGLSLMAALVLVAVTAVNGDSHLTLHDLKQKQAYEAAKAGIDDYAYHLHANNSYWTSCANITGETAVNNVKETSHRLTVPGTTESEYAVELLPSTTGGYSKCDTTHATESMLQSTDPLKGTFRIRSNGYAGEAHAAIVATFKPASFLDYVYFTQLETSDAVTYGETLEKAAEQQCGKTIRGGRYTAEIASGKGYCDVISFVSQDFINGPMHTNDAFAICGTPTLGGSAADPIEVSGPPEGWFSTWELSPYHEGCSGSKENFKGTLTANSAVLDPPPTNEELSGVAENGGLTFKGQVRICLSGISMTVMKYSTSNSCANPSNVVYPTGPLPANGVVYVAQSSKCPNYTPFNVSYVINSENEGCGNAYVEGTYSGQLTIGTYNNIVITGNLCMESCSTKLPLPGEGVLGLVANNFVRIYHPTALVHPTKCKFEKINGKKTEVCSEDTSTTECVNATGALEGVTIDAAILGISHSFIVDSYNCGQKLGTLTVNGAIAQKYRGAVGTGSGGSSGTGYLKSYNYDSRLKYIEPPSFIAPKKTAWVIGRETLE
jgi:hypothetical protein